MNRKLFALLLVLPLGFFAAERLIATNVADGGGKDKKVHAQAQMTTTNTQQEAQAAGNDAQLDASAGQTQQETVTDNLEATTTTTKEMAAFKSAVELTLDGYEEFRSSNDVLWMQDESIAEAEQLWLRKNVYAVFQEAKVVKTSVERSFSRCPTGVHLLMVAQDGVLQHQGWLVADEGCNDQPIGKFQYDMIAGTVQAFVGDELVDLKAYLKMYKAAFA
jgi:hypothetical protein